jgi:hypothetical protein
MPDTFDFYSITEETTYDRAYWDDLYDTDDDTGVDGEPVLSQRHPEDRDRQNTRSTR